MHLRQSLIVILGFAAFACGGSGTGPAAPSATVAVVPAPTPTPTPAPTPTPTPIAQDPNAEPVAGNGKVVKVFIKVFSVADSSNVIRPYEPGGPIYVGDTIRFDATGKDEFNQPTNGTEGLPPAWDWAPDEVAMLSGGRDWNPRARVKAPGSFRVQAFLDDVPSNVLELEFLPAP